MHRTIHFWSLRDPPDDWDPDRQPGRFVTGHSHAFLELYVRLSARGLPVTFGRWPERNTHVIVASLEELTNWPPRFGFRRSARLALAAARCPTVVLIRNDIPLEFGTPRYIRTEVMPNTASIVDPSRQVTLPLLPQRGIIPRQRERGDRIERLVLKAYSHNIPEFVLNRSFTERVTAMGIDFRIETETDKPLRWHDFHDVDVVLCVRRFWDSRDCEESFRRKPATKLINAWCAGVIPIVAPEAPYLELIEQGRDAILAKDDEEILAALHRLQKDPRYVSELLHQGAARATTMSADKVLDEWQQFLGSDLPSSSRVLPVLAIVARAWLSVTERIRRVVQLRGRTRQLLGNMRRL